MDEETSNEIDEMVNSMNLINIKIDEEMDEEIDDSDVYEKTNRINKKIDVVNKIDEEIDDVMCKIKKRIKMIDEKIYGLNDINKDDANKKK